MHPFTLSARTIVLSRLAQPVGRRELFLWLAAALFANQAILLLNFGSFSEFSESLALQNYIYWFGCYVALYRINKSDARASPEGTDWYFVFGMLLAILLSSFIAYRFAIGLIATVMALYLLILGRPDPELRAAGIVILALSAHLVWGPILFQLLTPELLRADAALVGNMLTLVRPDIIWNDTTFQTPESFAISLVGACSSFHNLSTALLACAGATMLVRTNWTRPDFAKLGAAVVVMIFMNDVRLCLLAWSPASYKFWHDGAGSPLLGFLTTVALLTVAFWGAVPRSNRG
jgi:exosortase/archaeosortase family protein